MNLSEFAFGTASVGSRINYASFAELVDLALQAGVRRFDSAPQYGRGLAQVFLQNYFDSNPGCDARISTKIGRMPVGDAKSLLIVLSRGRVNHALRLFGVPLSAAVDFSHANLEASWHFTQHSLDVSRVDSIFLHASPKQVLATGGAQVLLRLCGEGVQPGVAEPCAGDLQWVTNHGGGRWVVQVSAYELLSNPALQAFPGTVWINSIVRYTRSHRVDLRETMARLHAARPRDRVFVVGFNHAHMFDTFSAL